jgi:hypothetical protein
MPRHAPKKLGTWSDPVEAKAAREGRDPQLEKAVEIVLAKLKESPITKVKRPPFPNYYKADLKEPAEGK